MYNFEPYNILLAIATNIHVLLMTAFVLLGHIYYTIKQNHGISPSHFILLNTNMHHIATKTQDNIITSPQKQIIENDRKKVIQSLAVSQSQLIFFYWKGTGT